MRSTIALLAILVGSLSLSAQPSDSPQVARAKGTLAHTPEQSLPLCRAILYSNRVAYFERRGEVTGHAEINLSFKESQMDDVLKSMIVLDLGHGQIGAVNYTSSVPNGRSSPIAGHLIPESLQSALLLSPPAECNWEAHRSRLCVHRFRAMLQREFPPDRRSGNRDLASDPEREAYPHRSSLGGG
jgi:hypothetical protein